MKELKKKKRESERLLFVSLTLLKYAHYMRILFKHEPHFIHLSCCYVIKQVGYIHSANVDHRKKNRVLFYILQVFIIPDRY